MYYAPGVRARAPPRPAGVGRPLRGRFDDGWDAYRESVFARQKELGLLPADAELSPHDPDVPEWASLSADEKRLYARMMEVFAGFLSHADHHFGRLLDTLERIGELENTMIMVISDNGASAEGGVTRLVQRDALLQRGPGELRGQPGAASTSSAARPPTTTIRGAGRGRATRRSGAGSARPTAAARPTRSSWRGRPAWPRSGEIRTQYAHAIDMVPTVLDALGVDPPDARPRRGAVAARGRELRAHVRRRPRRPREHVTQYFEMFGHRAIYHDGWRAVCPWPARSFTEAAQLGRTLGAADHPGGARASSTATGWELFRMADDPTEARDVAAEHPDMLRELVARWWQEAEKYKVLPLDGSMQARLATRAPADLQAADALRLLPGRLGRCPRSPRRRSTTARTRSRPTSRSPAGGAEGVLVAQGGDAGGYAFYLAGRAAVLRLQLRRPATASSCGADDGLHGGPPRAALRVRADRRAGLPQRQGGPGTRAAVRRRQARRQHRVPAHDAAALRARGAELRLRLRRAGRRRGYQPPFPFTGTIHQVSFDLAGELIADDEAEMRLLMAQQ